MKTKTSKKGSAFDLLLISVFFIAFILISIMALTMLSTVNNQLKSQGVLAPAGQVAMDNMEARYPKIIDGLLAFIIIGLSLTSVIGAFAIRSHPIFYFVTIILLFIIGVINIILKDTYFAITSNPAFSGAASQFIFGTWFMTQFPFIMAVIGILIAIITYSRGVPE